ncbi:MAG TPA: hypothetical protein VGM84_27585 [Steroidobacteraceae bacterium]|jgi:hypothetical protein
MPAHRALCVLSLALSLVLAHSASAAGENACKAVNDAILKLAQTPNHSYTESSGAIAGGHSRSTERIATATAVYIQLKGKWLRGTVTPQREMAMQQDALRDERTGTCQYLRDEVVFGETSALYVTHKQDDAGMSDTQIWISRQRGLPLRQVVHLSVGGGKTGESQMTTKYVYENVHAPEGVS